MQRHLVAGTDENYYRPDPWGEIAHVSGGGLLESRIGL